MKPLHANTDPYDQVLVPSEDHDGSVWKKPADIYDFCAGAEATVDRILEKILQLPHGSSTSRQDMEQLRRHCLLWMQLCTIINDGFTALGISRVLPKCLHGVLGLQKRIDVLYTLAAYTVWDVQYAVFNLGYSIDDLCNSNKKTTCPKAPFDVEPDPVLRRVKAILTHPIGDYAVQPKLATFAAHGITMAHYLDGAAYTVGPTQNISIRSTSVVREMGGQALVDATVEQIIMEKGRAVGVLVRNTSSASATAGDEPVKLTEIRARNIVCATSVYNLYNKLLPQDHPVVREFHDPSKRTIRQSNGHVFLFCKIDGDATDLGLPQHNLWYFNSYDMDVAFDKYWANPTGERPPTVYIGFPCTKDPTWKRRLPGVSNCILISDGLWEWFAKWSDNTEVHHRGAEYEAFKEKLTKHLLDILYEAVPQIKGKVSYHTLGTPLSEVTYLSSWHAGSYGTMCLPSMFAPTNHQWTTTPHTKIPGLYLAGSDAFLRKRDIFYIISSSCLKCRCRCYLSIFEKAQRLTFVALFSLSCSGGLWSYVWRMLWSCGGPWPHWHLAPNVCIPHGLCQFIARGKSQALGSSLVHVGHEKVYP
jgi:phytoene dehydrogenase-like protein